MSGSAQCPLLLHWRNLSCTCIRISVWVIHSKGDQCQILQLEEKNDSWLGNVAAFHEFGGNNHKKKKKHQVFQRKTCCCKWLELLLCVCREVPRNNCCGFWNDLFPRDYFGENVTQSTRCIRGALARKMHWPGCWCSIPKAFPAFILFAQYKSLYLCPEEMLRGRLPLVMELKFLWFRLFSVTKPAFCYDNECYKPLQTFFLTKSWWNLAQALRSGILWLTRNLLLASISSRKRL